MDSYLTLQSVSEGLYKEKGSKFMAFAMPLRSVDEVKPIIEQMRKEHHDARHVCFAYMLGPEKKDYRANDDGEPSGTAGRPMLGAILSAGITNVMVVVVRYFGGTKLGTSGLINAYKTAAQDAIEHGTIIERTVDQEIRITFEYVMMNDVMKVIKDLTPEILSQEFDCDCRMTLSIRQSEAPRLLERLSKVESLRIDD